jgi:hypothetical protein
MMHRLLLLAALGLVASAPLQAEEGATLLRDTELRSEPFSDARVIAVLKARTTLTILQRRGGWYQARTASYQRGWVRMSAIRLGELKAGSSGVGETLRFLSSGRSGASGVTVATGIRGLSAADVANATPNHQALQRLGRYQASAAQARSFAGQAKLRSRQLAYMDEKKSGAKSTIPGVEEDW